MNYLLDDLLSGIMLFLAVYGLLSLFATIIVAWWFFSMPKVTEEDMYAGMQASLMGYAEQLTKEGK